MPRASLAQPFRHAYEEDYLITDCDCPGVERADDFEIIARRSQVAGPTDAGVGQSANHQLVAAAPILHTTTIAGASDAWPFSSLIRRLYRQLRSQAT
jgi:hypothetical protein